MKPMYLLDMRCIVIISILENIYVVAGHQRRMGRALTTQKSHYPKGNQRTIDVNYRYKDWELVPPGGFYDYDVKTTPTELYEVTSNTTTETIAVVATAVTSPITETSALTDTTQSISEMLNLTDTASTSSAAVTETISLAPDIVNETVQETNSTAPDDFTSVLENTTTTNYTEVQIAELITNTLPSDATLEDLLHWFASTTPNVYTTLIPPPPTINVLSLMPETEDDILDHLVPLTTTTKNPILEEIQEEINKTNDYFASSVRELIIVLSHKNSTKVRLLLMTMNSRLASAIATDTLVMFSNLMIGAFQAMLQMLMLATNDVRQEYFNYAIYALDNRHTAFASDINAVFDVMETIYTEKDVADISEVIKKVEAYPNITEDADTLVGEVMEVYILKPHSNIVGTAKEKLLMLELHTALEDRLFPGHDLGRRFDKGDQREIISRNFKLRKKTIKNNGIFRKHSKRIDKIQKATKLPKYKNDQEQRARNVKKIMSKEVHGDQRKEDRRLVKGAQKKITRTSSNSIESSLQSISSTSSESGDSKDSDIIRYKSESAHSQDKDKYRTDSRGTPRKTVQNNRYKAHSKKIRSKPKRYGKLITTLNDEEILKIRLKDALLHPRGLRRFGNKLDRITKRDSYSDDEAVLKSKIYKAFGFNHDIREYTGAGKGMDTV